MATNRLATGVVDLRTPEQRRGLTKEQRNIQAITGLMKMLGEAEQARRESQQLDSISRAMAGGATTIEAINAAVNEAKQTQFSGGVPGILQKIGGAFQPPSRGGIGQNIQQTIIGQRLQQALMPPSLLTTPEQKELALYGKREREEPSLLTDPEQKELELYGKRPRTTPSVLDPTERKELALYGKRERVKPSLLTPVERAKAARIKAGLAPKVEAPKPTKIQELVKEGYSREEARMIRDISHGLKPRASARKQYENMGDVEKRDFLSKLRQRAEGQYYGVEGGNIEPRQPKLLKWVEEEEAKLETEQTTGEPQSYEDFTQKVQSIADDAEAKAYYDKWAGKWQ